MSGSARVIMHLTGAGVAPTAVAVGADLANAWSVTLCVLLSALWGLTFLALRARDVAEAPPSDE